jgi:hypothetical protein
MPVVGGLASGRMRTPGRWWFVNSPQPQNQLNGPHDNRAACNRLAPPCSEFIDVDLCRVSDLLLIDTGKDASRFKPIPRAGLHGVARAGVAQREHRDQWRTPSKPMLANRHFESAHAAFLAVLSAQEINERPVRG